MYYVFDAYVREGLRKMTWLYFLALGPTTVGIVLAFAWWLIWKRRAEVSMSGVGVFALAAGLIALLADVATRLMGVPMLLPFEVSRTLWGWYSDYKYTIPLLVGILGVVLLTFPVRSHGGRGEAELARRTPASFARPEWFVAPGVALVLVTVITVLAGLASQPDPVTGRYTSYTMEVGLDTVVGTRIYGWFYSVPALVLIGALIGVTAVGLLLISRPALGLDREQDIRERTIRTRNMIAGTTGALLLHLGLIFQSLAGTASVYAEVPTQDGRLTLSTTFAALGPVFSVGSLLSATVGAALWATVVFSAFPSRRSSRVTHEP